MLEVIIGITTPLLVGILLFVLRSMHQRISDTEVEAKHFMPKGEVRELIEDKIGGLRIDIAEVKEKIDQLFELYIHDHQSRKKL